MKVRFKLNLTKTQKNARDILHREDTRILVCRWSRQSGKSIFAEVTLIEYLLKPKTFNAYISPTFAQGRRVYKELTSILQSSVPNLIKSCNASTLTIEMTNGSILQFFSMESPTSIRGNTIKRGICVIDECAFIPDLLPDGSEPWGNVIYPILKAHWKRNKVLIISTPSGKRGMFYDFYLRAMNGEKGIYEICANIYDDSLIDPEQIAEIQRSIPPLAFRQEFLCEWLDSALTYFSHYEECFTEYEYVSHLNNYIGIDLSATEDGDETVVTIINNINQTKQIVIDGDLTKKYQQIANIINTTPNLRGCYIEQNGVGFAMIDSIKKLLNNQNIVTEWVTTNTSKMEILSALAIGITDKALSFHKDEKQLYAQFGGFIYKYTKHGNMQLEARAGLHDDRIMSMAIAYKCKQTVSKLGGYVLSKPKSPKRRKLKPSEKYR